MPDATPAGDSPTPRSASSGLQAVELVDAASGYSAAGTSSPVCTTEPSSNDDDDRAEQLGLHARPEHLEHRRLDDAVEHLRLAAVVERLDLDLARRRRGERVEVGDARHDLALAVRERAPRPRWRRASRSSRSTSRADTPERWFTCGERRASWLISATISVMNSGTRHLQPLGVERPRLLLDDRHLELGLERVVRADLRAEAVLERRDDAAAVRVVLGVRRRDEQHVEREADLVAADLHVALFEHVEQTDLDALGEVGELVDREDAAVRARHEPVVDRQLVGEVAAFGDLDRVDLADEVGDRRVGRRELLAEAAVAVHPLDRRVVAALGDEVRARATRPGGTGRR